MGQFNFNDGGREAAGYKGRAGDCVCRAIAIAAQLPYQEVYDRLAEGNAEQRKSKRTPKRPRSARNGINTKRQWFKDYMLELGFVWTPTMQIGSGCKVHLKSEELPSGRLVCNVSRHQVAVIDGVIQDTYDSSRGGTRCVYGYWTMTDKDEVAEYYPNLTQEEEESILSEESDEITKRFQELDDQLALVRLIDDSKTKSIDSEIKRLVAKIFELDYDRMSKDGQKVLGELANKLDMYS